MKIDFSNGITITECNLAFEIPWKKEIWSWNVLMKTQGLKLDGGKMKDSLLAIVFSVELLTSLHSFQKYVETSMMH